MPAFDIFMMPSLYEAFPYVLIEATAAGLPIVATPVGGTSAMIQNAANGFLISDTEYLVQALARLVEDPSLCRRMGETSRRIARTYTVQNMVKKPVRFMRSCFRAELLGELKIATARVPYRHAVSMSVSCG